MGVSKYLPSIPAVVSSICSISIAKGLLIWLETKGIHLDKWIADMIGVAESGVTSYPAITYMLLGISGLIGLAIGPSIYGWCGEKAGRKDNTIEMLDDTAKTRVSHHDGFIGSTTATLSRFLSADISFVNFNVPRKAAVSINSTHVLTDFVTHAPSTFVGNAKLPLKFFSRYTMPRSGKEINSVEPKSCKPYIIPS